MAMKSAESGFHRRRQLRSQLRSIPQQHAASQIGSLQDRVNALTASVSRRDAALKHQNARLDQERFDFMRDASQNIDDQAAAFIEAYQQGKHVFEGTGLAQDPAQQSQRDLSLEPVLLQNAHFALSSSAALQDFAAMHGRVNALDSSILRQSALRMEKRQKAIDELNFMSESRSAVMLAQDEAARAKKKFDDATAQAGQLRVRLQNGSDSLHESTRLRMRELLSKRVAAAQERRAEWLRAEAKATELNAPIEEWMRGEKTSSEITASKEDEAWEFAKSYAQESESRAHTLVDQLQPSDDSELQVRTVEAELDDWEGDLGLRPARSGEHTQAVASGMKLARVEFQSSLQRRSDHNWSVTAAQNELQRRLQASSNDHASVQSQESATSPIAGAQETDLAYERAMNSHLDHLSLPNIHMQQPILPERPVTSQSSKTAVPPGGVHVRAQSAGKLASRASASLAQLSTAARVSAQAKQHDRYWRPVPRTRPNAVPPLSAAWALQVDGDGAAASRVGDMMRRQFFVSDAERQAVIQRREFNDMRHQRAVIAAITEREAMKASLQASVEKAARLAREEFENHGDDPELLDDIIDLLNKIRLATVRTVEAIRRWRTWEGEKAGLLRKRAAQDAAAAKQRELQGRPLAGKLDERLRHVGCDDFVPGAPKSYSVRIAVRGETLYGKSSAVHVRQKKFSRPEQPEHVAVEVVYLGTYDTEIEGLQVYEQARSREAVRVGLTPSQLPPPRVVARACGKHMSVETVGMPRRSCEECAVQDLSASAQYSAPFMWNGRNYLLVMLRDLDFLGDLQPLVDYLGPHFPLRRNPLLLAPLGYEPSTAQQRLRSQILPLGDADAQGMALSQSDSNAAFTGGQHSSFALGTSSRFNKSSAQQIHAMASSPGASSVGSRPVSPLGSIRATIISGDRREEPFPINVPHKVAASASLRLSMRSSAVRTLPHAIAECQGGRDPTPQASIIDDHTSDVSDFGASRSIVPASLVDDEMMERAAGAAMSSTVHVFGQANSTIAALPARCIEWFGHVTVTREHDRLPADDVARPKLAMNLPPEAPLRHTLRSGIHRGLQLGEQRVLGLTALPTNEAMASASIAAMPRRNIEVVSMERIQAATEDLEHEEALMRLLHDTGDSDHVSPPSELALKPLPGSTSSFAADYDRRMEAEHIKAIGQRLNCDHSIAAPRSLPTAPPNQPKSVTQPLDSSVVQPYAHIAARADASMVADTRQPLTNDPAYAVVLTEPPAAPETPMTPRQVINRITGQLGVPESATESASTVSFQQPSSEERSDHVDGASIQVAEDDKSDVDTFCGAPGEIGQGESESIFEAIKRRQAEMQPLSQMELGPSLLDTVAVPSTPQRTDENDTSDSEPDHACPFTTPTSGYIGASEILDALQTKRRRDSVVDQPSAGSRAAAKQQLLQRTAKREVEQNVRQGERAKALSRVLRKHAERRAKRLDRTLDMASSGVVDPETLGLSTATLPTSRTSTVMFTSNGASFSMAVSRNPLGADASHRFCAVEEGKWRTGWSKLDARPHGPNTAQWLRERGRQHEQELLQEMKTYATRALNRACAQRRPRRLARLILRVENGGFDRDEAVRVAVGCARETLQDILLEWQAAPQIQRLYRGHRGRQAAASRRQLKVQEAVQQLQRLRGIDAVVPSAVADSVAHAIRRVWRSTVPLAAPFKKSAVLDGERVIVTASSLLHWDNKPADDSWIGKRVVAADHKCPRDTGNVTLPPHNVGCNRLESNLQTLHAATHTAITADIASADDVDGRPCRAHRRRWRGWLRQDWRNSADCMNAIDEVGPASNWSVADRLAARQKWGSSTGDAATQTGYAQRLRVGFGGSNGWLVASADQRRWAFGEPTREAVLGSAVVTGNQRLRTIHVPGPQRPLSIRTSSLTTHAAIAATRLQLMYPLQSDLRITKPRPSISTPWLGPDITERCRPAERVLILAYQPGSSTMFPLVLSEPELRNRLRSVLDQLRNRPQSPRNGASDIGSTVYGGGARSAAASPRDANAESEDEARLPRSRAGGWLLAGTLAGHAVLSHGDHHGWTVGDILCRRYDPAFARDATGHDQFTALKPSESLKRAMQAATNAATALRKENSGGVDNHVSHEPVTIDLLLQYLALAVDMKKLPTDEITGVGVGAFRRCRFEPIIEAQTAARHASAAANSVAAAARRQEFIGTTVEAAEAAELCARKAVALERRNFARAQRHYLHAVVRCQATLSAAVDAMAFSSDQLAKFSNHGRSRDTQPWDQREDGYNYQVLRDKRAAIGHKDRTLQAKLTSQRKLAELEDQWGAAKADLETAQRQYDRMCAVVSRLKQRAKRYEALSAIAAAMTRLSLELVTRDLALRWTATGSRRRRKLVFSQKKWLPPAASMRCYHESDTQMYDLRQLPTTVDLPTRLSLFLMGQHLETLPGPRRQLRSSDVTDLPVNVMCLQHRLTDDTASGFNVLMRKTLTVKFPEHVRCMTAAARTRILPMSVQQSWRYGGNRRPKDVWAAGGHLVRTEQHLQEHTVLKSNGDVDPNLFAARYVATVKRQPIDEWAGISGMWQSVPKDADLFSLVAAGYDPDIEAAELLLKGNPSAKFGTVRDSTDNSRMADRRRAALQQRQESRLLVVELYDPTTSTTRRFTLKRSEVESLVRYPMPAERQGTQSNRTTVSVDAQFLRPTPDGSVRFSQHMHSLEASRERNLAAAVLKRLAIDPWTGEVGFYPLQWEWRVQKVTAAIKLCLWYHDVTTAVTHAAFPGSASKRSRPRARGDRVFRESRKIGYLLQLAEVAAASHSAQGGSAVVGTSGASVLSRVSGEGWRAVKLSHESISSRRRRVLSRSKLHAGSRSAPGVYGRVEVFENWGDLQFEVYVPEHRTIYRMRLTYEEVVRCLYEEGHAMVALYVACVRAGAYPEEFVRLLTARLQLLATLDHPARRAAASSSASETNGTKGELPCPLSTERDDGYDWARVQEDRPVQGAFQLVFQKAKAQLYKPVYSCIHWMYGRLFRSTAKVSIHGEAIVELVCPLGNDQARWEMKLSRQELQAVMKLLAVDAFRQHEYDRFVGNSPAPSTTHTPRTNEHAYILGQDMLHSVVRLHETDTEANDQHAATAHESDSATSARDFFWDSRCWARLLDLLALKPAAPADACATHNSTPGDLDDMTLDQELPSVSGVERGPSVHCHRAGALRHRIQPGTGPWDGHVFFIDEGDVGDEIRFDDGSVVFMGWGADWVIPHKHKRGRKRVHVRSRRNRSSRSNNKSQHGEAHHQNLAEADLRRHTKLAAEKARATSVSSSRTRRSHRNRLDFDRGAVSANESDGQRAISASRLAESLAWVREFRRTHHGPAVGAWEGSDSLNDCALDPASPALQATAHRARVLDGVQRCAEAYVPSRPISPAGDSDLTDDEPVSDDGLDADADGLVESQIQAQVWRIGGTSSAARDVDDVYLPLGRSDDQSTGQLFEYDVRKPGVLQPRMDAGMPRMRQWISCSGILTDMISRTNWLLAGGLPDGRLDAHWSGASVAGRLQLHLQPWTPWSRDLWRRVFRGWRLVRGKWLQIEIWDRSGLFWVRARQESAAEKEERQRQAELRQMHEEDRISAAVAAELQWKTMQDYMVASASLQQRLVDLVVEACQITLLDASQPQRGPRRKSGPSTGRSPSRERTHTEVSASSPRALLVEHTALQFCSIQGSGVRKWPLPSETVPVAANGTASVARVGRVLAGRSTSVLQMLPGSDSARRVVDGMHAHLEFAEVTSAELVEHFFASLERNDRLELAAALRSHSAVDSDSEMSAATCTRWLLVTAFVQSSAASPADEHSTVVTFNAVHRCLLLYGDLCGILDKRLVRMAVKSMGLRGPDRIAMLRANADSAMKRKTQPRIVTRGTQVDGQARSAAGTRPKRRFSDPGNNEAPPSWARPPPSFALGCYEPTVPLLKRVQRIRALAGQATEMAIFTAWKRVNTLGFAELALPATVWGRSLPTGCNAGTALAAAHTLLAKRTENIRKASRSRSRRRPQANTERIHTRGNAHPMHERGKSSVGPVPETTRDTTDPAIDDVPLSAQYSWRNGTVDALLVGSRAVEPEVVVPLRVIHRDTVTVSGRDMHLTAVSISINETRALHPQGAAEDAALALRHPYSTAGSGAPSDACHRQSVPAFGSILRRAGVVPAPDALALYHDTGAAGAASLDDMMTRCLALGMRRHLKRLQQHDEKAVQQLLRKARPLGSVAATVLAAAAGSGSLYDLHRGACISNTAAVHSSPAACRHVLIQLEDAQNHRVRCAIMRIGATQSFSACLREYMAAQCAQDTPGVPLDPLWRSTVRRQAATNLRRAQRRLRQMDGHCNGATEYAQVNSAALQFAVAHISGVDTVAILRPFQAHRKPLAISQPADEPSPIVAQIKALQDQVPIVFAASSLGNQLLVERGQMAAEDRASALWRTRAKARHDRRAARAQKRRTADRLQAKRAVIERALYDALAAEEEQLREEHEARVAAESTAVRRRLAEAFVQAQNKQTQQRIAQWGVVARSLWTRGVVTQASATAATAWANLRARAATDEDADRLAIRLATEEVSSQLADRSKGIRRSEAADAYEADAENFAMFVDAMENATGSASWRDKMAARLQLRAEAMGTAEGVVDLGRFVHSDLVPPELQHFYPNLPKHEDPFIFTEAGKVDRVLLAASEEEREQRMIDAMFPQHPDHRFSFTISNSQLQQYAPALQLPASKVTSPDWAGVCGRAVANAVTLISGRLTLSPLVKSQPSIHRTRPVWSTAICTQQLTSQAVASASIPPNGPTVITPFLGLDSWGGHRAGIAHSETHGTLSPPFGMRPAPLQSAPIYRQPCRLLNHGMSLKETYLIALHQLEKQIGGAFPAPLVLAYQRAQRKAVERAARGGRLDRDSLQAPPLPDDSGLHATLIRGLTQLAVTGDQLPGAPVEPPLAFDEAIFVDIAGVPAGVLCEVPLDRRAQATSADKLGRLLYKLGRHRLGQLAGWPVSLSSALPDSSEPSTELQTFRSEAVVHTLFCPRGNARGTLTPYFDRQRQAGHGTVLPVTAEFTALRPTATSCLMYQALSSADDGVESCFVENDPLQMYKAFDVSPNARAAPLVDRQSVKHAALASGLGTRTSASLAAALPAGELVYHVHDLVNTCGWTRIGTTWAAEEAAPEPLHVATHESVPLDVVRYDPARSATDVWLGQSSGKIKLIVSSLQRAVWFRCTRRSLQALRQHLADRTTELVARADPCTHAGGRSVAAMQATPSWLFGGAYHWVGMQAEDEQSQALRPWLTASASDLQAASTAFDEYDPKRTGRLAVKLLPEILIGLLGRPVKDWKPIAAEVDPAATGQFDRQAWQLWWLVHGRVRFPLAATSTGDTKDGRSGKGSDLLATGLRAKFAGMRLKRKRAAHLKKLAQEAAT